MVWLIFILVLHIFTSLIIHDDTLCWELRNFLKLAVCRRSLQHGRVGGENEYLSAQFFKLVLSVWADSIQFSSKKLEPSQKG